MDIAAEPIPTIDESLANSIRLLRAAEMETDRSLIPNLTAMSGLWLDVAVFLDERETLGGE